MQYPAHRHAINNYWIKKLFLNGFKNSHKIYMDLFLLRPWGKMCDCFNCVLIVHWWSHIHMCKELYNVLYNCALVFNPKFTYSNILAMSHQIHLHIIFSLFPIFVFKKPYLLIGGFFIFYSIRGFHCRLLDHIWSFIDPNIIV